MGVVVVDSPIGGNFCFNSCGVGKAESQGPILNPQSHSFGCIAWKLSGDPAHNWALCALVCRLWQNDLALKRKGGHVADGN